MVLLGVGILCGGLGLLIFQGSQQFYARPLSYHLDVVRRQ